MKKFELKESPKAPSYLGALNSFFSPNVGNKNGKIHENFQFYSPNERFEESEEDDEEELDEETRDTLFLKTFLGQLDEKNSIQELSSKNEENEEEQQNNDIEKQENLDESKNRFLSLNDETISTGSESQTSEILDLNISENHKRMEEKEDEDKKTKIEEQSKMDREEEEEEEISESESSIDSQDDYASRIIKKDERISNKRKRNDSIKNDGEKITISNIVEEGEINEEEEKEESLSKANRRYYEEENPYLRCYRCNKSGHIAMNCIEEDVPEPICCLCGIRHSVEQGCPVTLCYNCHTIGHKLKECPYPKQIRCFRCDLYGHTNKECKTKLPVVRTSRLYCYNCGAYGHSGRECSERPAAMRDPFSKIDKYLAEEREDKEEKYYFKEDKKESITDQKETFPSAETQEVKVELQPIVKENGVYSQIYIINDFPREVRLKLLRREELNILETKYNVHITPKGEYMRNPDQNKTKLHLFIEGKPVDIRNLLSELELLAKEGNHSIPPSSISNSNLNPNLNENLLNQNFGRNLNQPQLNTFYNPNPYHTQIPIQYPQVNNNLLYNYSLPPNGIQPNPPFYTMPNNLNNSYPSNYFYNNFQPPTNYSQNNYYQQRPFNFPPQYYKQ